LFSLLITSLNPYITVTSYPNPLLPSNALSILEPYDVILDCTDNLPTRYLLSDAAVILGKPLVSGAAMRLEGQMCVWNLNPPSKTSSSAPDEASSTTKSIEQGEQGPCYRCIFPTPPASPPGGGSCEEVGILGVVTGVIGTLQAAEAIKIILGKNDPRPTLLLYSILSSPTFRSIKLRGRKLGCIACGDPEESSSRSNESGLNTASPSKALKLDPSNTDYVQFCGGPVPDWETAGLVHGTEGMRITPQEMKRALDSVLKQGTIDTGGAQLYGPARPLVLDVRPRTEFGICSIEGSINIPITELLANPASAITALESSVNLTVDHQRAGSESYSTDVYVVCRLGNDSQLAADALRDVFEQNDPDLTRKRKVRDLVGGLRLWAKDVDEEFPVY
jgi:adenylyltransferase/sulfurtransferase